MKHFTDLTALAAVAADDVLPIDDVSAVTTKKVTALDLLNTTRDAYLSQSDWYINASTGNNANDGATSGTALATAAELYRRLGPLARIRPAAVSGVRVWTLHVMSSLPTSDPVNISLDRSPDTYVRVLGGVDVVDRTGTFTSVVAKAPAGSARVQVGDTAFAAGFGSVFGKRLRITSGARLGAYVWIASDVSATTSTNVSDFSQVTAMLGTNPTDFTSLLLTQVTQQVGDPYAIETLRKITLGSVQILTEGSTSYLSAQAPDVVFGELEINTRGDCKTLFSGPLNIATYSCRFTNLASTCDNYWSLNDCVADGTGTTMGFLHVRGGRMTKSGGLVFASSATPWARVLCSQGGTLILNYDSYIQNGQLQVGGGLVLLNSAFIRNTNDDALLTPGGHAVYVGLEIAANASLASVPVLGGGLVMGRCTADANVRLWGGSIGGDGVYIAPGNTMLYPIATPPTLTGNNDVQVGDASITTARAYNEATGVYFNPGRALSWATLVATTASGGFGGSAYNVTKRAAVISQ